MARKKVTVYTTTFCSYCVRAKALLKEKGVDFSEVDVSDNDESRAWLLVTTGRRTVPQIFFGDEPIGGYDDLSAIVRAGQLEARLDAAV